MNSYLYEVQIEETEDFHNNEEMEEIKKGENKE